jgi:hypothetical protein
MVIFFPFPFYIVLGWISQDEIAFSTIPYRSTPFPLSHFVGTGSVTEDHHALGMTL